MKKTKIGFFQIFFKRCKKKKKKIFFLNIKFRKHLIIVSFLFACVITLSNLGLDKVQINIHILLRATSLCWVIVFSFFLKSENPTLISIIFAFLVGIGAILLTIDQTTGFYLQNNYLGVIINLVSSFCSGVMYVALRFTIKKTEKLKMTIIEVIFYKIFNFLIRLLHTK